MTNAEKYLKDEVFYHDLACEIAIFISNSKKKGMVQNIDEFFKQQIIPTLTENERVILRNIDAETFKTLGRNKIGYLYLRYYFQDESEVCNFKNDLFKFIKNGEEYSIKELLNNE